MKKNILIIDGNHHFAAVLEDILRYEGFNVWTLTGETIDFSYPTDIPDLILINQPPLKGKWFDFVRRFHETNPSGRLLVLSDSVRELAAESFPGFERIRMAIPFSLKELVAKVKSLIEPAKNVVAPVLRRLELKPGVLEDLFLN